MENSGSFSLKEIEGVQVFVCQGYFNQEFGVKLAAKVEELFKAGKNAFVLDFQPCTVVNSQGISAVMDLAIKIFDDYRGKFAIANLDQVKQSTFQLVGVIPLVPVGQTVADAVKLLLPVRP